MLVLYYPMNNKRLLPKGFKLLNCITKNNSYGYINLGFNLTNYSQISFIGGGNTLFNDERILTKINDNTLLITDGISDYQFEVPSENLNLYLDYYKIKINEKQYPISISLNNNSSLFLTANIINCLVIVDKNDVKQYLPCLRESDNTFGLFETTTLQFYQGEGYTGGKEIEFKEEVSTLNSKLSPVELKNVSYSPESVAFIGSYEFDNSTAIMNHEFPQFYAISVCFWYKPLSETGNLIDLENLKIQFDQEHLYTTIYTENNQNILYYSREDADWHFVTVTYDGYKFILYIDTQYISDTIIEDNLINSNYVSIGNDYNGYMSNLNIYDHALDISEIKNIYKIRKI